MGWVLCGCCSLALCRTRKRTPPPRRYVYNGDVSASMAWAIYPTNESKLFVTVPFDNPGVTYFSLIGLAAGPLLWVLCCLIGVLWDSDPVEAATTLTRKNHFCLSLINSPPFFLIYNIVRCHQRLCARWIEVSGQPKYLRRLLHFNGILTILLLPKGSMYAEKIFPYLINPHQQP